MNVKKLLISIIIIFLIINIVLIYKTYAISEIISNGDGFIAKASQEGKAIDEEAIKKTNDKIYNILLGIGVAVAVIIGAVLGIQFIFQSAEGKAKISEALVPYIVGCFVVFGAFGIWKMAIEAGNSITDETTATSQAPVLTWDKATSAKDYIDNGGKLKDVDNETLLSWYGQLSRLSENSGIDTDYYNKVRAEIAKRGGYDTVKKDAETDKKANDDKIK